VWRRFSGVVCATFSTRVLWIRLRVVWRIFHWSTSGDHLKAASDLCLPVVGVGLLYRQGYFKQVIDHNGYQSELYPENEISKLPLIRALDPDGNPVSVQLRLVDQVVTAIVWQMNVGSVPLLLLDTEIPENTPENQRITWRLYGGDRRMRLNQELLLAVGGYRALLKLGYNPEVCHINEGHAAFLSLARAADLMQKFGLDMDSAVEVVWRTNVFTTHTPVPAGNEVFPDDLLRPYLEALRDELGIDVDRVMRWGKPPMPITDSLEFHPPEDNGEFSMTILGLRMAYFSNGVSKLHGNVARNMWAHLWPGRPVDEVPITHVTNGVHHGSWISQRVKQLYDQYMGPDWIDTQYPEERIREMIDRIPDEELWRTHELNRASLVRRARQRIVDQLQARNATHRQIMHAKTALDPDALTVGFARRFATYKRGTLLLRDADRLRSLLRDVDRPIQLVYAGKAHPADEDGKRLIQRLVEFSQEDGVGQHIVFLEDYDMRLARCLVQGVDVWLNTPRRPQEASGTSGMKAAANGALNCSILDGWWAEAYCAGCGWAITSGEGFDDPEYRDTVEAQALYNLLENEIVPCFYDRRQGDFPALWVHMMKESIKLALCKFSSQRMVGEYYEMFYQPGLLAFEHLMADNAKVARKLAPAKRRYANLASTISLTEPEIERTSKTAKLHVGDVLHVTTEVTLGKLKPDEVIVEVYWGPVDARNKILESHSEEMTVAKELGDGRYLYAYDLACPDSGQFALTTRVQPAAENLKECLPGFITWAGE
jgi:starch phosphorylase